MTSSDAKVSSAVAYAASEKFDGTDDWTVPDSVKSNVYFVEVTSSLVVALLELERRMVDNLGVHLITRKKKRAFGGKCVQTGEIGIWNRNGRPVIALEPGNYWNFSMRHAWQEKSSITSPVDVLGLTTVLVGQSEAAVVMDPANRIFVIRNSGFAAYGSQGCFKVIEIVDTLNLGESHAHYESSHAGTNGRAPAVLGWKRDVNITVSGSLITVATFFLVPANNVLILQRGNELLLLKAGQHVITNPNTSFRGFYSLGERQTTFRTQPAYTVEGVPVILNVNLRYRIADPILLTANYDDAFSALANPAQTAVNSVVSRLSYQQFMRAQRIGGDVPDHVEPWLDAFKSACLSDLRAQATGYGIIVESFDVLDRELEGALGKDLERQSEQVLRNQVQATQIELQNHIATETQRGKLEIAKVEAEQKKTQADAQYYVNMKESDAKYYAVLKDAEAMAESSNLKTTQDVKNSVKAAQAAAEASALKTAQDVKNSVQAAQAAAESSALKTAQDVKNSVQAAQADAESSALKISQDVINSVKSAQAAAESSALRNAQDVRNLVQQAQASAESSALKAEQDAANVVTMAAAKKQQIDIETSAYAQVPVGHAQLMQLSVFEVEKLKALPAKTIYFSGNEDSGKGNELVAGGLKTAMGWKLAEDA
ncbi:hypothetical protein BJ741DRAFT_653492 [Chytriomyces cf. hyalinus JEL632]|nr:hypothetical protein BJ741DRAFT_653492 [Chytriomyces cf. hyalinus JEL632]